MKKIVFPGFLAIACVVTITACKKESHVVGTTRTIVLPVNGASVINANNQFAFKFLKAAILQDPGESNKLISPLSIYLALSMVYNGAASATRDSMAVTLQLSGININDLNAVCKSLIEQLPQEDNRVQFSIANSVWYKDDLQPLPSFLSVLQNYYYATAQPLHFNDPAATTTINNWVAEKTNNKIPKIIDNIAPGDLMYLINAIYFKGAWQYEFNTSGTHNDNFHLQNGTTASVPFMEQKLMVNSYSDSLLSMVELPYGGGKSYSMYIVLPNNPQQPVNTFASLLDEHILGSAINKMTEVNLQLDIPKWEYAYSMEDMKPALTMLGMGITFEEGADLSAMYDPGQAQPFITRAIHKTYIKVNEEGTEAAAVTGIAIGETAFSPFFKADHPFIYTIIEKQTGAVLFAGIVNDPSKN